MALKFFFDECTDEDVAKALQNLGIDVITLRRSSERDRLIQSNLLLPSRTSVSSILLTRVSCALPRIVKEEANHSAA
jgi:hypothetical protein